MSSRPDLARLATEALARERREPPAPTAEAEARTVDAIARAIEREARRVRVRRVAAGVAAAAACVGAAIGLHHYVLSGERAHEHRVEATGHALAGAVVVLRRGAQVSLDEGSSLGAGDRIVAPAGGRAAVSLSTGTQLLVEGGSDFNVVGLGAEQSFLLLAGALRADVAKLGAGQRFVVRTGDAEIEVRGTSFRVAVVPPSPSCARATTTRVSVSEGTVVVRAAGTEERVGAGRRWPTDCADTTDAQLDATPRAPGTPGASDPTRAPAPSAGDIAPPPRALGAASAVRAPSAPAAPPASSDIAEQNRAYAEATNAKRRGATREAIVAYEAFLARFPSSQLAESAMVERMRLLATTDRSAAAEAARAYIARYPSGFARQEAGALASGRP